MNGKLNSVSDSDITTASIWPVQHRAALIVVVHVDAQDPHAMNDEGIALGLDYAVTGLPRLLRTCDDLGIEATTAWTAQALASHPQLARTAHEHGHELSWSTASLTSTPGLKSSSDLIAKITGQAPAGYIESLPGGTSGAIAPGLAGQSPGPVPSWIMTGAGGDTPVIAQEGGAGELCVQIPLSPYWVDATWFHPRHPGPPSSLLEAWSASLASVRAEGGLMTIVLHPHIAGRPGFADAIVRFLDETIASGDVWIARADHLALWWKSNAERLS